MSKILEVRKCAYLKTPKWKWTIHNSLGGSFSNSGEYRSLKSLGRAFRAQYPGLTLPVRMVTIHGITKDNEVCESIYEMTFADMFGNL